jgi:hypothetical protein
MGSQRVGFKDFEWFVQKFSAGIKKRTEQIAPRDMPQRSRVDFSLAGGRNILQMLPQMLP